MIGGAMLLMTIGAMMLILLWADKYDDLADSAPRGGFFAMTAGRAGPYGKKRGPKRWSRESRDELPPPRLEGAARRSAQERWGEPAPLAPRRSAMLHEAEAAMIAAEIAEDERQFIAPRRRSGGYAAAPERESSSHDPAAPEDRAAEKAEAEDRAAAMRAVESAVRARREDVESAARARRADQESRERLDAEALARARRQFGGLA